MAVGGRVRWLLYIDAIGVCGRVGFLLGCRGRWVWAFGDCLWVEWFDLVPISGRVWAGDSGDDTAVAVWVSVRGWGAILLYCVWWLWIGLFELVPISGRVWAGDSGDDTAVAVWVCVWVGVAILLYCVCSVWVG